MVDYWHVSGDELIHEPGLLRLRRFLPVLALIGAPYAGAGSSGDPSNPLDPVVEWGMLVQMLDALPHQQHAPGAALALGRVLPPTLARLREVLTGGEEDPDAFRVVHIVAQGEHGMLLLENPDGGTQIVSAEAVTGAIRSSGVRVVLLDGCFSEVIADLLLERSPVQAVIGTRRKLPQSSAAAFNTAFYAALSTGEPVDEAFRTAVGELDKIPGGGADRYELVLADEAGTVPLPGRRDRAERALLLDGQPRAINVPGPRPDVAGFVGRREMLARLAEALPEAGAVIALHGPAGIGKTWLAAQAVERFAWRFPDGVLWLGCNATTTDHGVLAQIARLVASCAVLETHPVERADILRVLKGRRVLVVLDDLDVVTPDDERARILHAMRRLCEQSDSRVIVTARELDGALAALADGVSLPVERFSHRAARTLAMRLAVERGLDVLDVDTIDDFLDRTQGVPWLVTAGVRWIETERFRDALDRLAAFPAQDGDPLAAHVAAQVRSLGPKGVGMRLLRRAARLPEAFDRRLAMGLGGDNARQQIAALVERDLLVRDGDLYRVPSLVRALVNAHLPLNATHRAQVDRVIMLYLTRTWPPALQGPDRLPDAAVFARVDWARLANARALLRQPAEGAVQIDAAIVARLLVAAAPMLRAAGLVSECAGYARAVLDRLPPDVTPERARVEIVLASCEDVPDAGPLFQRVMVLPGLAPNLVAEAGHNYGRALLAADDPRRAAQVLGAAFDVLRDRGEAGFALPAALLHDWARALRDQGHDAEAIVRYREALAAYARLEHPNGAAAALYELGTVLVREANASDQMLETLERAEDLLRRALVSADRMMSRALATRVRIELAELHNAYALALAERGDRSSETTRDDQQAEWESSSALLLAARLDCARSGLSPDMAGRLLALSALVDMRRGVLADAGADARRSADISARTGDTQRQAEMLTLAGRLLMAQGDSVAAQAALHDALDQAAQVGAQNVLAEAAAVLVRVHHIRARHAPQADAEFTAYTREQVQASRARLSALGLTDYVEALDRVLAALG